MDPGAAVDVLQGGGELGARMRAIDWSRSPLGPVEAWPASLKTCVRIILTSRQPMFVWWGDALINLYNDAYRAIVGGKHPEALGQPAAEVWREIWDQVGPRAATAMRDNEGTYDEALLLVMERNGYPEETYYTFSYSPVPNDRGGTGGIICANTDDTRRIIGERQLTLLGELAAGGSDARTLDDAVARSAAAMATNPRDLPFALIYLLDADRRGLDLAAATGIARGHELAPTRVALDAPSPWPLAAVLSTHEPQLVDALPTTREPVPTGAWPRAPRSALAVPLAAAGETGRAGVLVVGLNPLRLPDESYRTFLGLVARQIAASIGNAEAYEQERRRAEALAEIDRAKTAFFSNVSHEFRTPLTLMLGPTEDALAAPERALSGAGLETVHRNALRLLRLVNSLLDFSRIEAGRVQAVYVPTDLATLTTDLASAFRSAIERAGLTLTVDAAALPTPVYVDTSMWEKIVLNLVSNAFKFTFEGGVTVALRAREAHAELTVSDTGTGIAPDQLPHVFERFHRVEGARSRSFEGSGIGLALVHELVRLHGGEIRVASTPGRGTTFTVCLPFGTAHLPAERIGAAPPRGQLSNGAQPFVEEALRWLPDATEGPAAGPPLALPRADEPMDPSAVHARVLLADDNADMRDYVRRLLGERYEVRAVRDGVEALAAARAERPDLVVTDVMMPGLDGFGLLRALRADAATRRVPVIMLSARAGEEARVEGIEAGADDYLTKPFSARELLARVTLHLELARAREAIEAQRAALHNVFVHAPVAIAVWQGPEHVFVLANTLYEQVFGHRDVVGRKLAEVFTGPELAELRGIFDRVQASGEPHAVDDFHVRYERADEGRFVDGVFSFTLAPLRDAAGRVRELVAVAVDLTEQVRSRERVESLAHERIELLENERAARQEAERANRTKDEFLATMSHELRTPLNAMLGWTRMLRTGSVADDKRMRALETIERNAQHQAALIEDVLDVARITTGKLRLDIAPVEMATVVESAVESVRPASEAKNVRIQLLLDPRAGRTMGDANRLQQVVWNLLSNAVKFTPKGERVHVRLRREHSQVEMSVEDTGQGIEPAFLPHVFERFRQADATTTRTHGGLGLGLSIVKHLVELHGGTIDAQSEGPDRGAVFTVRIPVSPLRESLSPAAEPPQPPSANAVSEGAPRLDGLTVLIVDDEPDTRELVEAMLRRSGAEVYAAGSAAEAMTLLHERRPDVLVSDIGMPGEDGYALIRKVRALPASEGGRTPAVALTAYARMEDRTRALATGYNNHVAKPVDPSELLVVIASLAERFSTPA